MKRQKTPNKICCKECGINYATKKNKNKIKFIKSVI